MKPAGRSLRLSLPLLASGIPLLACLHTSGGWQIFWAAWFGAMLQNATNIFGHEIGRRQGRRELEAELAARLTDEVRSRGAGR